MGGPVWQSGQFSVRSGPDDDEEESVGSSPVRLVGPAYWSGSRNCHIVSVIAVCKRLEQQFLDARHVDYTFAERYFNISAILITFCCIKQAFYQRSHQWRGSKFQALVRSGPVRIAEVRGRSGPVRIFGPIPITNPLVKLMLSVFLIGCSDHKISAIANQN
jgi:hypothetical protein